MALRKPLFMGSEGWGEEMAAADSLELGGLTMSGDIAMANNEVTGLPSTPSGDTAAASKAYVDTIAAGLHPKESVKVRAQGSVTLSGPGATIDGVTMSVGDRFLADQQSTTTQDGIYAWQGAAVAATRTADAPVGAEFAGVHLFVQEGTDADTGFVCTNDDGSDVVGTDDLVFAVFSGPSSIPDATSASGGGVKGKVTADSDKGLVITAGVMEVNIDAVTLDFDPTTKVIEVTGLPLLFEINGTAVGATVTAANLDTLTDTSNADGLHTHAHSQLSGVTADQHHNRQHGLESTADHTLSGATAGEVLRATGATTFAFQTLAHSDLGTIGPNDHHNRQHAITSTGDHSESGLTAGHVLTATGATTFAWQAPAGASEAQRIEVTLTTATDATSNGDPVYFNGSDTIGQARADTDAKARVIGLIRSGAGAAPASVEVVSQGEAAGVLTGATPNTPYYLGTAGGLSTSLPGAGNRVIQMGIAMTANDLWVHIHDYGKKAA